MPAIKEQVFKSAVAFHRDVHFERANQIDEQLQRQLEFPNRLLERHEDRMLHGLALARVQ